jgi:hypothetical protein
VNTLVIDASIAVRDLDLLLQLKPQAAVLLYDKR